MPRTAKTCGECQAKFGPTVTPGRTTGLCSDCSPHHTLHLALAGDFATYCGKSMRDVNADDAQDVAFELTHRINCLRCLDIHSTRRSY